MNREQAQSVLSGGCSWWHPAIRWSCRASGTIGPRPTCAYSWTSTTAAGCVRSAVRRLHQGARWLLRRRV